MKTSHLAPIVVLFAVSAAVAAPPVVMAVRPVPGAPDLYGPGIGVANLDAGDLVSGASRWDNDGDGIVFSETYVSFLASPGQATRVFAIPEELYYGSVIDTVSEIADNGICVGTNLWRREFRNKPYVWTPTAGFNFLPCSSQGSSSCMGSAAAVTADGTTAVGYVAPLAQTLSPRAARWSIADGKKLRLTLKTLETADPWSNAWDVSADGDTTVGDSGADEASIVAARWVGSKRKSMQEVGSSSSALFVADDASGSIGWAVVDGVRVIVRWDASGNATVAAAPGGGSVETIRASNRAATAAVGAYSIGDDWAPFVWTLDGGFVTLPENGRESDYDRSEAFDVSDDGSTVVGYLGAQVISNGDPPQRAFYWNADTGFVLVNDLMTAHGETDPDYFFADAISGDGARLLVTGNVAQDIHDTDSVIVTLARP
jgi:uncharacterized membrane protein